MTLHRRAAKRDAIEPEVIEALRSAGARVWQLSRPFDLLCGFSGRFTVLEVKSGKAGRLTAAQRDDLDRVHGLPVYVVRSVDEALRAVGLVR